MQDEQIPEEMLRMELFSDEIVEWKGAPQPGHMFSVQDLLFFPYVLFMCGLLIFFVCTMGVESSMFVMLPSIFLLIALPGGYFCGRLWMRKRTFYAITDRRLIIICGRRSTSINHGDITGITKQINRDGTGSLYFELPAGWGGSTNTIFAYHSDHYCSYYGNGRFSRMRFQNIDDPHRIHRLILEKNKQARGR